MKKFSAKTIEEIKYYVYVLVDPRDNKIFYVGKGEGNRVFTHSIGAIKNPVENDKISVIKEIIEKGMKVKHYIIRHTLEDEKIAYEIEATLIDFLTFKDYKHLSKITNIAAGHHSWNRGIKTAEEVELLYSAKPLYENDIAHNLLLININKTYGKRESTYEATRKHWKLNHKRIMDVELVCGEFRGIIRGIYKPKNWFIQDGTNRMFFEGTEVTDARILKKYLNKAYIGKKKGQANPIRYLMKRINN
jgi:uncharacterized protein